MSNASEQEAAHGDVEHGFGGVEALFIVPNKTAPSGHPSEGSQGDLSVRQGLKAGLLVPATDDFQHEILGQRRRQAVG